MPSFSYRHRVRYRECDPMGVVYHAHYLDFLEYARTEALRECGLPYKEVEESGVIMPVVDLSMRFHAPARYDDVLKVLTHVEDRLPTSRLSFEYEVFIVERSGEAPQTENKLAVTASLTLCFASATTGRPQRAPRAVVEAFERLLAQ